MSNRVLILVAAVAAALGCGAAAQQMPMAADSLPKECRMAAHGSEPNQSMHSMTRSMSQKGQPTAKLGEAQKGYLEAMMKMRAPTQMGIMANDPDVGFICGMIPHHQGAVDMAEVVLKTGHNAEAKRFAEQVIKEQGQQISWMKEWLKKYADKEEN
ncbi:DUF305 domain-containing protein [Bradyrhizobium diazoefficiens]|uniref:DUF305 domain-containing protein n=1 Tax=Bradyrhizobium diazoefficiens TaxID=1355477 RepID=UPI00190AC0B2|nr:DUF305 domain-containing protein [Bradyrhizobium diazoefficiens]QQO16804.1 DUF305 domain-containing protein [Bradyrhizobium diazoefficiens]